MAKPMLLLAIVAGFVALSHQLTQDEVNAIRGAIDADIIMANSVTRDNGRAEYPRAATLVRLSFHDCPGGCDGCVDKGNIENRGLGTVIDELDVLFTAANKVNGQSISALLDGNRGDFYALAGLTGLMYAARMQRCRRGQAPPLPELAFKTGRESAPDCANSPPARRFPDSHHGFNQTMEYFRTEFGFNQDETTALLGVHTLGEARGDNSGFRGPWVRNKGGLNNEYFTDMANAGLNWAGRSLNSNQGQRFQWNHNGQGGTPMMLQADMCLLKRVNPAASGQPSCTYGGCPESPTGLYSGGRPNSSGTGLRPGQPGFESHWHHKSVPLYPSARRDSSSVTSAVTALTEPRETLLLLPPTPHRRHQGAKGPHQGAEAPDQGGKGPYQGTVDRGQGVDSGDRKILAVGLLVTVSAWRACLWL